MYSFSNDNVRPSINIKNHFGVGCLLYFNETVHNVVTSNLGIVPDSAVRRA
jgi:hypothetical protein